MMSSNRTSFGNVESTSRSSSPAPVGIGRKLEVLHVGKFYPPHMGGIETHLQALCGQLRNSADVQVIVANDDRSLIEETLDGVPVVRVPTWFTLASTPLCPAMVAKIRAYHGDILHLHLPNPMAVLAYLSSCYRGRLVVTYHSDMVRQKILGPMFEPFLHAALRRASAIITTSPNYLRNVPGSRPSPGSMSCHPAWNSNRKLRVLRSQRGCCSPGGIWRPPDCQCRAAGLLQRLRIPHPRDDSCFRPVADRWPRPVAREIRRTGVRARCRGQSGFSGQDRSPTAGGLLSCGAGFRSRFHRAQRGLRYRPDRGHGGGAAGG